jgi:hypothetical protein
MVLFDAIPENYLELVWPYVIGFSLTAKTWGDCLLDGLEDILFSKDVFDRLVLPDDRKRLIKALVKHSSPLASPKAASGTRHNFQDLIKGKGEGTVQPKRWRKSWSVSTNHWLAEEWKQCTSTNSNLSIVPAFFGICRFRIFRSVVHRRSLVLAEHGYTRNHGGRSGTPPERNS